MNINDFIPPILSRFLKKFFIPKVETSSLPFFLTYSDALKECGNTGYEYTDLVETIFEKTRRTKDQMLNRKTPLSDSASQSCLAILYVLQTGEKRKEFKVIDFGGACGSHYFQVRPFLPPDIQIEWAVVETPAMVEKARLFETSELYFFKSIHEASEKLQVVDLLHSSGAFQYVADPEVTINEFVSCQPAFIFLNRLALSTSKTLITIQESLLSANGPGPLPEGSQDRLCRYPVTYFPKRQFETMLLKNYRMEFEIDQKKALVGRDEVINTGIFAKRLTLNGN